MRENQDALPDNARYTSIMSGQTHSRFGSEVTIDDVARAAEVSIRTVSRVLNNSTKVNRDTRARVEEAVARLGFRPSLRARGLATGRSFLMGLLHDEHNALHLADVLRGAAREAGILACALSAITLDGYAETLLYDEKGAAWAAPPFSS